MFNADEFLLFHSWKLLSFCKGSNESVSSTTAFVKNLWKSLSFFYDDWKHFSPFIKISLLLLLLLFCFEWSDPLLLELYNSKNKIRFYFYAVIKKISRYILPLRKICTYLSRSSAENVSYFCIFPPFIKVSLLLLLFRFEGWSNPLRSRVYLIVKINTFLFLDFYYMAIIRKYRDIISHYIN